jgi:hypothetical protein
MQFSTLSLSIAQEVSGITQTLESQRIDDDRGEIIQWLSTTDPSTNYHAACQKRQPGSGRWLLESSDFKQLFITRKSILWLRGIRK